MIVKYIVMIQLLALIVCLTTTASLELKELKYLINLISGDAGDTPKQQTTDVHYTTTTRGYTKYSFLDYVTQYNDYHCASYKYVKGIVSPSQNSSDGRRAPIKIKCLFEKNRNKTMQIVNSPKDVVTLFAPHGNSTKRTEPGICALILFYSKSCPISVRAALHFNAVYRQFPDLRMGAIDALRFHGLNTDFGIVGLPTIMLFHQGRPVVKFNDTPASVNNFNAFVTRHTGLQPKTGVSPLFDFLGPLTHKVEMETDYCLYLAWIFIIMCTCYYFTKSKLYSNIIEVIKRNWQESEAQHEHQL